MSKHQPPYSPEQEEEEEEEDYMTMTFDDHPPTTTNPKTQLRSKCSTPSTSTTYETSLQRHRRLRREAEARARPKSNAELAAEADARREAALSRSLFETRPESKGLAMMARMGFRGGSLGRRGDAGVKVAPITIHPRLDRSGIGLESDRKRKLREAAAAADTATKRARADEGAYRDRLRREREEARWSRQLVAAQRVLEGLDSENQSLDPDLDHGGLEGEEEGTRKREAASRPLKSIPVVYRGLIRSRETTERDRRMRHDLEHGLAQVRWREGQLPGYDDADEDGDDKMALGKERAGGTAVYVTAEDLDEEDEELEAFEGLPVEERLEKVVGYLRGKYRYCFWCKFKYPDEGMEGCPGVTEEEHD
ncbi:uncharacterized protein C8A04DRAFT_13479 [Dichotomopilus funicola]|uniref:G-patch domain-containing protein n=1 Tax=Dichotomopilus funicola TaxID=1934379 RepID=A0AAN6ZLM1_9PEZI|nr:hypothetical protein C8A04DRAFT_13479 [Dichotomopilus funicola]